MDVIIKVIVIINYREIVEKLFRNYQIAIMVELLLNIVYVQDKKIILVIV